jgi:beta-lactamase regulating signal transducer with metallopeptidase domain
MPTYQWFIGEFVPAICRTLLHSLWQALIAALIAGVVILCTRKTSAALRYNAFLVLFGSLLTTVAITFFFELRLPSANERSGSISIVIGSMTIEELDNSIVTAQPNFIAAALAFVDKYSIALVSTWFLFFLFQLTRMAFGLSEIHKIRIKNTSRTAEKWSNWITEKSKELGIRQSVLLLQSTLAKVPVAIGHFKPVILVPVGLVTNLSVPQVQTVLLHELAHIKRNDYIVNMLQSFADAIFFFNPAFVWLSSLIRQEREKCCDDVVIRYTSNQHNYLEALVSFQEMNLASRFAMAIGSKKYYLLNRVKRILTRENSRLSLSEVASLLVGFVVFGIMLVAFKPMIPQQTSPKGAGYDHIDNQVIPISATNANARDTVPQKSKQPAEQPLRFKKVISNIVDDWENNTFQVEATEENGTVYKIRRKEHEVTEFYINGREIPKSQYDDYAKTMNAIERARKKQLNKALKKEHEDHDLFPLQFEILTDSSMSLLFDGQVQFTDSMFNHEHLFNNEINQSFQFHLEASPELFNQNTTVEAIINDLLFDKLIQNDANVSFTLSHTEFIVNGKHQSKTMHEKFKSKYIKHPADRFKYSKQGKSTKTEVYIN